MQLEIVKRLKKRDTKRTKAIFLAEIAYVYLMYNPKSAFSSYSSEKRHEYIVQELKLPDKWKVDDMLKEFIHLYRNTIETPATKTLVAAKEALNSSTRVINFLRFQVDNIMDGLDGNTDVDPDIITGTVKSINELLKLTDSLPKAIQTIENLEEKVKKEQTEGKRIRSGGSVGAFEN